MRKAFSFLAAVFIGAVAPVEVGAQHPQVDKPSAENFGTVHFSTSCASTVSRPFDRAVAILHSFEFGLAIKAFNQILATDSTCAMAYWGLALSNWTNPFVVNARGEAQLRAGREFTDRAGQLAAAATGRERGYVKAVARLYGDYSKIPQGDRIVAYERAMSDLVAAQPQDTEAKIFYAISLTASAPPTDKTYANRLKAAGILEPLFALQPNHPGLAHYLIHTYDVPALADRAALAAKRYSEIAPSAAHALHMPSHTFTREGMWRESVATNLRSMEVAKRSNSSSEALHASDYATYAYLQMGQDRAARAILRTLPEIQKVFDAKAITGAAPASAGVFAMAAIPARVVLETRSWKEAAALQPTQTAFPWTDAMTWFARALGASHTGDLLRARESIDSLTAIRSRIIGIGEAYWAQQVNIQRVSAQAWLDFAHGESERALRAMQNAAAMEDSTDKSAVSPGPLVPARELLGDMYLEMQRPAEALTEYRRELQKEPNRFRGLYGAFTAAKQAGRARSAEHYLQALRRLTEKADRPGRPETRTIRSENATPPL